LPPPPPRCDFPGGSPDVYGRGGCEIVGSFSGLPTSRFGLSPCGLFLDARGVGWTIIEDSPMGPWGRNGDGEG